MHWQWITAICVSCCCASVALAERVTPSDRVRSKLNVRKKPVGSSAVVGSLWVGETAHLIHSVRRWHYVRLDSEAEGYVPKGWTKVVPAVPFSVHFLDVGTGDAVIIDMGDREIVIDGGLSANILHDYAAATGIIDGPIELVIVTHGDADHWMGLVRLFDFDERATSYHLPLELWDPGYDRPCRPLDSYDRFIRDVLEVASLQRPLSGVYPSAVETGTLEPITLPQLPDAKILLLHTDSDPQTGDCAYKINNSSIVVRIDLDGTRFLFTGDGNGKRRSDPSGVQPAHVEKKLLALEAANPGVLNVDVLKVPHHGSESASTKAFIDATDPKWVIFSASTVHELPRESVVRRYKRRGRKLLRTDRNLEEGVDHIVCTKGGQDVICEYVAP